jgi:hypothetical protein
MSESTPPVEDQPTDQDTPELDSQTETTQPDQVSEPDEAVEIFSDTFDPATLDEALRPAYQQMRADYTKKTQSLSEQRKEIEESKRLLEFLQSDDPDEQRLALHALGYDVDLPDEEDAPEYDAEDNELAELKAELAEIREWQQGQQEQSQQAEFSQALDAFVNEELDNLEKSTGRKFDDKELDLLAAVANATPDADDLPDFRAAYERLYGDFLPAQKKAWMDGKKPAPAPGKGTSGTPQVDLSDDDARIAQLARDIEAGGG